MTGQIPKYGKHFRRERLPYDPALATLASRRYVLKANADIYIRSTNDSEHWLVYYRDQPVKVKPYDTFREAMPYAIALGKITGGDDDAR